MTPDKNIQALLLLQEDMADILDYCDKVSLSVSEHAGQLTHASEIHHDIEVLSLSSSREILDVHEPQIESCYHNIEPPKSAPKRCVFEFSEEFEYNDDMSDVPFAEGHHYSSCENANDETSDISESLSDDGTFSFVDDEEELMPNTHSIQESRRDVLQYDWRRASILTWSSRYSMMEDSQLLQGASIMASLAR